MPQAFKVAFARIINRHIHGIRLTNLGDNGLVEDEQIIAQLLFKAFNQRGFRRVK